MTESEYISEARRLASTRLHGRKTLPGWGNRWVVVRVTGDPGLGGCFAIYGVLPGGVLSKYSDELIHV